MPVIRLEQAVHAIAGDGAMRLPDPKNVGNDNGQKYFGTRNEFAQVFGLDPLHSVVGTYWYHRLVLENGERWFCASGTVPGL